MPYSEVVFVSGPYRAANGASVLENIRAAEAVAIEVWRKGYTALCPHKNTAHFDGILPDDAWLEGDMELLKRSDYLILLPIWKESAGARAEVGMAYALGIPVLTSVEELP